ncbi:MAG: 2-oxoacid:ferredoxin oxidoreductase subunit gamma [Proteobacteria bacterium]|nr:2-oxoacid:ferredoxin oxidoreductase subunit gamma [Pseudomonadota bacterium]
MRIRFAGFGGQGIVSCGLNLGKAAMRDGKNSAQTQSYGSASRGGLTRADVTIQDDEIYELDIDDLDVLVALSQQSYDKFIGELLPTGKLFYEADMVVPVEDSTVDAYGIPATDLAFKEFGRKIIANMIIMGLLNEIVGLVSYESLTMTIKESVPEGTEDLNIRAFNKGMQLGKELLAERQ